jgi:3-(3-hydroxy-phenyl)propionate hydroxylase
MKPKPRFKAGAYLGMPRRVRGAEGTLPPQPVVRCYDGRPVRLDDALGTGWAVIGIGVDPRERVDAATWEQIDAQFATLFAPGTRPQGAIGDGRRRADLVDLEDTDGKMTRWLRRHRIRPGDVLVLRPDKYVFGAGPDGAALSAALREQLGLGAFNDRTLQREVAV